MESNSGKSTGAVIEALLFTMGRSVSIKDLAQVIGVSEKEVREEAGKLINDYQESGRGLRIVELEDSLQMCAAPDMYDYINAMTQQPVKPVLTGVMLETLAIIAYKQPVTRAEIEQIRGVNCSHAVNRLLERCGLQEKLSSGEWKVTKKGERCSVMLDTGKRHSNGTMIRQIKWTDEAVGLVKNAMKESDCTAN